MIQKITPFLWFDTQAEEAVNLYVSLFKDSKILNMVRNPKGAPGPEGSIMIVAFELDGVKFTAMNGGPMFTFNESISMVITCEDQTEVDHFWNGLTANGGHPGRCGWLKDRYGLSWQVVPHQLQTLMSDPDPIRVGRVMAAMMAMDKIDTAGLEQAADATN